MFFSVTNARDNSPVMLNPAMVGMVRVGNDSAWPATKTIITLNDSRNTFIPCKEEYAYVMRQLSASGGGVANRGQAQASEPADTRDVPDNTNER